MKNQIITLLIGLGIIYLALTLFLSPFNNTIAYFEEHGHSAKATIVGKETYEETFETSNGDWEHVFNRINLEFEDSKMKITRTERADKFISNHVYANLEEGEQVAILYLDFDKRFKDGPDVLLLPSINSSFFDKLTVAFKGDLSRHAIALLLLVSGILVAFIGLVLTFGQKKDTLEK